MKDLTLERQRTKSQFFHLVPALLVSSQPLLPGGETLILCLMKGLILNIPWSQAGGIWL